MRDIDQIMHVLLQTIPGIRLKQLVVRHPGVDDDGLWFFTHPESVYEVQLESSDGMCPFLVETNENSTRMQVYTVHEAAELVKTLLHLQM
jgi:hypothetical protein